MTEKRGRIQAARAMGELVLIVAGVLIALGAESAWEDRGERLRAEAYLDALRADMVQARAQVEAAAEATQARLQSTDSILNGLRGIDGGAESLGRGSHALGGDIVLPTGTLAALIETGDVNLLSPELRASVVETYAVLLRYEGLADDLRSAMLENLTRYMEARESLGLGVPRDQPFPVEAARRAPSVVASVEVHRFFLSNRSLVFESILGSLDEILATLDA